MYKVIGAVLYTIIDDYIYFDYMGLIQNKLSKHGNKFENIKFKGLSGLEIPEIYMDIMSCYGFAKYSISTVILTYQNALVLYEISKGFIIALT